MKFENTETFNFKGAIRGMRNPLESWNKSDSFFGIINIDQNPDYDHKIACEWVEHENQILAAAGKKIYYEWDDIQWDEIWNKYNKWLLKEGCLSQNDDLWDVAFIGPKDLNLMQRLILAGPEHMKFMRQIFVSVDITAPIYW